MKLVAWRHATWIEITILIPILISISLGCGRKGDSTEPAASPPPAARSDLTTVRGRFKMVTVPLDDSLGRTDSGKVILVLDLGAGEDAFCTFPAGRINPATFDDRPGRAWTVRGRLDSRVPGSVMYLSECEIIP